MGQAPFASRAARDASISWRVSVLPSSWRTSKPSRDNCRRISPIEMYAPVRAISKARSSAVLSVVIDLCPNLYVTRGTCPCFTTKKLGYGQWLQMFNRLCSSVQGKLVRGAQVDPKGWLALDLSASHAIGVGDDRAELILLIHHLSDDQPAWRHPTLQQLVGCRITNLTAFGPFPEILLTFDTGLLVASVAVTDGEPSWVLVDHREHELALIEPKPSLPPETLPNFAHVRIAADVHLQSG